jgi:hypothetical protein
MVVGGGNLKNAERFQESAQRSDNGNAYGNSKHPQGKGPLVFISTFQFVPQTIDGSDNLLKAFVHIRFDVIKGKREGRP